MSESQSPVPVSLSGVSGISACHFRTFQSLAELWIFGVGSATFSTTDGLFDSKPVKLELPPRCSHAHSFEFFLGILPLNPRFFFHHLVPHVCPSIWHIENSRASLWNQRKRKVICLSISQALFLLLYHFHMNMNIYETHDLTDYQLTVGSFLPESLSCEVINESQGDLNSSNSNYFLICSPLSISIAQFIFEVSISILCVLIWTRQSPFVFESSPVLWSRIMKKYCSIMKL